MFPDLAKLVVMVTNGLVDAFVTCRSVGNGGEQLLKAWSGCISLTAKNVRIQRGVSRGNGLMRSTKASLPSKIPAVSSSQALVPRRCLTKRRYVWIACSCVESS